MKDLFAAISRHRGTTLVGLGDADYLSQLINQNEQVISSYNSALSEIKDSSGNKILVNGQPINLLKTYFADSRFVPQTFLDALAIWKQTLTDLQNSNGYVEDTYAWKGDIASANWKNSFYPNSVIISYGRGGSNSSPSDWTTKNPDGTFGLGRSQFYTKFPNESETHFQAIVNLNSVVGKAPMSDRFKPSKQWSVFYSKLNTDQKSVVDVFGQDIWLAFATNGGLFDNITDYAKRLILRTNLPKYGNTIINGYLTPAGRYPTSDEFSWWMNQYASNSGRDVLNENIEWFKTRELDRASNPFSPSSDYSKYVNAQVQKYGGRNPNAPWDIGRILQGLSLQDYVNELKNYFSKNELDRASNPYSPQSDYRKYIVAFVNKYFGRNPSENMQLNSVTQFLDGGSNFDLKAWENGWKNSFETGTNELDRAANPYSPKNETYTLIVNAYNQYKVPVPEHAVIAKTITALLDGKTDIATVLQNIVSQSPKSVPQPFADKTPIATYDNNSIPKQDAPKNTGVVKPTATSQMFTKSDTYDLLDRINDDAVQSGLKPFSTLSDVFSFMNSKSMAIPDQFKNYPEVSDYSYKKQTGTGPMVAPKPNNNSSKSFQVKDLPKKYVLDNNAGIYTFDNGYKYDAINSRIWIPDVSLKGLNGWVSATKEDLNTIQTWLTSGTAVDKLTTAISTTTKNATSSKYFWPAVTALTLVAGAAGAYAFWPEHSQTSKKHKNSLKGIKKRKRSTISL